jgi:flagellar hook-basal body complex protein FliE
MIDSVKQLTALTRSSGVENVSSLNETIIGRPVAPTPGMQTGMSFASMLSDLSVDAVNNLKRAEVASFEGIQGKANTREVVDAVITAEQSLQTAIALRDKIVNAYLEITKMQI